MICFFPLKMLIFQFANYNKQITSLGIIPAHWPLITTALIPGSHSLPSAAPWWFPRRPVIPACQRWAPAPHALHRRPRAQHPPSRPETPRRWRTRRTSRRSKMVKKWWWFVNSYEDDDYDYDYYGIHDNSWIERWCRDSDDEDVLIVMMRMMVNHSRKTPCWKSQCNHP